MEKKNEISQIGLNAFITSLNANIGFVLGKENKKDVFNSFAVDNTEYIVLLYNLLHNYSEEKKIDINIPKEVIVSKADKKVKFVFKKDLDTDVLSDIIEKNGYERINIDEDNAIEISKKSKK